jgi:lipid-A-disaccharide synthase
MRYYIIAGEASGDLHGGNLIRALHRQDAAAEVRCWGGDRMEAAGATLVRHYRDLAFMGFVEVLRHLRTIFRNIEFCKKDIQAFRPDVLVLIDYPGFNMRIAKWARQQGLKVVYYISPQIWAWKEGRVHAIRRDVDNMLVILPFEEDFYRKWNYPVTYVGHPLVEVVEAEQNEVPPLSLSGKPVIALLPGSRAQEIRIKLPYMLQMVKHFPNHSFAIACAPSQPESLYREIAGDTEVLLVKNAYHLLRQSKAALVTSGTATLETALFGVPQVVCYKGNQLSYWLARKLIRVKYISLVNLIMDKPVVKELIQHELNETNLKHELERLLFDEAYIARMKDDYAQLKSRLGSLPASENAAAAVVATARQ